MKIATRYRVHDEARTAGMFRERIEGAIERGVDLFIINESTPVNRFGEWEAIRDILSDLKGQIT